MATSRLTAINCGNGVRVEGEMKPGRPETNGDLLTLPFTFRPNRMLIDRCVLTANTDVDALRRNLLAEGIELVVT